MPRNLDLTAIRSFVTVAETGGVTRTAGQLNLTQSAVSMQLKRLEESIGQPLLDRSGRKIGLTAQGEQLLSYGRRMLALNDEVWARMTDDGFEGEIRFGVPADIVYPYIPDVLRRFAAEYPRVRVELVSSYTTHLKERFERGALDLILTTEVDCDAGGEVLLAQPLEWVGAPGGSAWRKRPIKLAFERACIFRPVVQQALDEAGVEWDLVVESESTRTIDATVSADLAVHVNIAGNGSPYMQAIPHGGALPDLPEFKIGMYQQSRMDAPLVEELAEFVRQAYGKAYAQPQAAE